MKPDRWEIDGAHSSIQFTVRHMLVSKVRGRFTKWTGTLRFDEKNLSASSVDVDIDANSVETNEPQRDAHLRSPDFLDAAAFPRLTFKSTRVEKTGDRTFKVTGDLSIRGVIRTAVLNVEHGGTLKDPWGKERAGFTATTKIDRKEFGVSFNQVLDVGGLALGEEGDIAIDLEATRVVEAQSAQAVSP
jgi:polyisoprenoid-binding protein YceI